MNSSMSKKFIQRTLICLAVLYGFLVVIGSELVPPVYTATAEVNISATPTKIWRVLTEFTLYKNWNPYLIATEGELKSGQEITITLRNKNFDKPFTTTPVIASVNKNKSFHWVNGFPVPGIYDSKHYFILKPTGNGQTILLQYEEFRGVLVWLLPGKDKRKAATEEGFNLMHNAMKTML
ncbi:MAG: hypothetical protein ACI90U_000677 [Pseudomonadales bacterium]|jgi:hypothetical protein